MKLTREEAHRVVEHGAPSINNRRHYLRYGGVFYPLASVVWTIETGDWPTSTPRHLDGNPANNDFGNLRKPGRAKARRKTRISVMEQNQPVTEPVLITRLVTGFPVLEQNQPVTPSSENPASLFA